MAKGAAWEREVSKKLSLWFTNNSRDDIFWRSSGSGARATVRAKKNIKSKNQYGDISFTDPIGELFVNYFLIELKRGYSDLGIMLLVDGRQKDPVLIKWWLKAEEEKKFGDRKAVMLIIKRDFKHPVIVFDRKTFSKMELICGEWADNIISIFLTGLNDNLIVIPFYSFLKYFSSESMKLFLENENKIKKF